MSFGGTAIRFGSFVSLYFALFKILERIIERHRKRDDSWNAFIAGMASSVSIIFEEGDTRWILAQYLLVRAMASAWCNIQGKFPILKSYTWYGDSAIFALCSGQAVYNFVVRPETMDPAYSHFLTRVTQMDPTVIELFRNKISGGTLDPVTLTKLINRWSAKGVPVPLDCLHADTITCNLIHPDRSCLNRILWILYANFRMVFPMYFSLHLVPPLLFRFKKSLDHLNGTLLRALKNACQSSTFMSTYVFIFQIILCIQRNLMEAGLIKNEWRMAFWWMGFVSAGSVLIEKKERRAELALYMLPRAGVAFYRGLVAKGWAKNIPNGEFLMMAVSMGVIMKTFRKDEKMLSSIVARILRQFL